MTDEIPKPADQTAALPIARDASQHPAPGGDIPVADHPVRPGYAGPASPAPVETRTEANTQPLLYGLIALALVVIIGGILLWNRAGSGAAQVAALQDQVNTLQSQLQAVQARPAPPDYAPRLTALDQRLNTLEHKPPPEAQLDSAGQKQIADLAGRVDGIAARQNQLGTQEQADVAKIGGQISDLGTKVAAAIQAGSEIGNLAGQQARTAQLQAAAAALAAGRPLGAIPNAPPALAQFATKPPPTEASLRLSFDAAAAQAHTAGQPTPSDAPFLTRLWDRAQSSLTVRQGDRVLVGDAVSGVLEHARHQLDAGDLAGAVSALDGLAGPAAAAMAPWRAQAQSLLDARAALISTAHG